METAEPHTQMRRIEKRLLELDQVPLVGGAPFPLETLREELARTFHLDQLTLSTKAPNWRSREEVITDLGDDWVEVRIAIPTLAGEAAVLIGGEDVQAAMRLLLGGDRYSRALYDSPLRKAFTRFLVLEVIHTLSRAGFPPGASPRLLAGEELMEEQSLCIDCTAESGEVALHARLLLSPLFLDSWRQEYAPHKPEQLNPHLAAQLQVPLSIQAGEVVLSTEELEALKPGDFVVLDSCGVDPETGAGVVSVTCGEEPLFRGRVSGSSVTLEE